MADEIITKQELIDAKPDVKNLGEAANGNETGIVTPRYGEPYLTAPAAIKKIIDAGGFRPFSTEVELKAYTPTISPVAAYAFDTKKVWLWNGSAWIDEGTSALDVARSSMISIFNLDKAPFSPNNLNLIDIYNGSALIASIDDKNMLNANIPNIEPTVTAPFNPGENNYSYEFFVGTKSIMKLDDNMNPIFIGAQDEKSDSILSKDLWFNNGDNLFFANETGAHSVLAEKVLSPTYLNDKASIGVVDRKWFTDGYQQAIISKNGFVYPNPEKTLLIIPILGQSLGFGDKGQPVLTTTNSYPEFSLKFKDLNVQLGLNGLDGNVAALNPSALTDFDAIISQNNSNGSGENIGVTLAQQLAKQLDDEAGVPMRVLSFTAAVNGTSYTGIKKGTQAYSNLLIAVTRAKDIAEAKGWKVIMPAFIMQHGEANRTTAVSTYKANLAEYIADINNDIKSITGQSADIYMYYINPCGSDTVASMNSTQAMYELAKENPLAVQVGSIYPAKPIGVLNDLNAEGDMTHLTASGYIYLGYKYVQALKHDLKNGMGTFKGVYPVSVTRTNNLIDIKFNVPKPPLIYKTSDIVRAHATWGLSYSDSTNSASITNIEIIGSDTVRVTLSNTPTGSNKQIKGGHIPRTDSTLATRPRINIADSTTEQTPYGDSLANWAIAFNEFVN